MKIRTELTSDKILVVAIVGDFDNPDCEAFEAKVESEFGPGIKRMILDLSEMTFCTSTAIECMLRKEHELSEKGGAFAVAGPQHLVRRVFERLELDRWIPIHESVDAARRAIAG